MRYTELLLLELLTVAGKSVLLLIVVALCGCDRGTDNSATPSAPAGEKAIARTQEPKVLKSQSVEAVFTGWELGDYLWAQLEVEGKLLSAWPGASPIDYFLDYHERKPIVVQLETILAEIPEGGGKMQVQRIAGARTGNLTAQEWWQSRNPEQRREAQLRIEALLGPPPPPEE
jgi:hypothetical protein